MALTWCLWMYVRATAADALGARPCRFRIQFCARVLYPSAVSAADWTAARCFVAWALRRLDPGPRVRAALAFLLPSAILAALFLGSLWAQNGSPWRIGYSRYGQLHRRRNGFRFTSFVASDPHDGGGVDFSQVAEAIARTAMGMFRLSADLFGWPSSFALIVLALPVLSGRTRLLWWMFGSYLLMMLFQRDWGIDTFGPMHAFELALPVLVLTIVGARDLSERLTWAQTEDVHPPRWRWSAFPPALLAALMVTAWLGFVPVRLEAVRQIAAHVKRGAASAGNSRPS